MKMLLEMPADILNEVFQYWLDNKTYLVKLDTAFCNEMNRNYFHNLLVDLNGFQNHGCSDSVEIFKYNKWITLRNITHCNILFDGKPTKIGIKQEFCLGLKVLHLDYSRGEYLKNILDCCPNVTQLYTERYYENSKFVPKTKCLEKLRVISIEHNRHDDLIDHTGFLLNTSDCLRDITKLINGTNSLKSILYHNPERNASVYGEFAASLYRYPICDRPNDQNLSDFIYFAVKGSFLSIELIQLHDARINDCILFSISQCVNLTRLSLVGIECPDLSMLEIIPMACTQLNYLQISHLYYCARIDFDVVILTFGKCCVLLDTIILNFNQSVCDSTLLIISKWCYNLKHLSVIKCHISCQSISIMLQNGCDNLESLDIRELKLKFELEKLFDKPVKMCLKLKTLRIGHVFSCKSFGLILRHCPNLFCLDLSCLTRKYVNPIGLDCIELIIQYCSLLKVLKLVGQRFAVGGLTNILKELELEELYLLPNEVVFVKK